MRQVILLLLFAFFLNLKAYGRFEKKENIRIYSSNSAISKVVFHVAEVISVETNIPINISFENEEEISEKIVNGEKADLLITDSYELLKELQEKELISLAYVSEFFYDKLVFVPLSRRENLEMVEKGAIFFKTSKEDKDVISNNAEKIPSILILSNNICRKINSLRTLYEDSYDYIIIKESVAKKCDFHYSGFFNDLYNLYYVAIIKTSNFEKTNNVFKFIENSAKIKEIIKNNGYSK